MNNAMTKDADYVKVRNEAARALHKKGTSVRPSTIDKTIRSTKTKMKLQLDELRAQMEALDRQKKTLETIDNPEDALKFMKNSGLKPDDIERLLKEAGMTEEDKSRIDDVNETVEMVTEVSSNIKELSKKKEDDTLDSDDEDETDEPAKVEKGDIEREKSLKEAAKEKKKCMSDFEEAFKNNHFNNAISNKKAEVKKRPESGKTTRTAVFSSEYNDALFTLAIELPGVKSMKSVDLQVSQTKVRLRMIRS